MTLRWTWAIKDPGSPPFPFPWNPHSICLPCYQYSDVVLRPPGWYTWLSPVKTSIQFLRFWQVGVDSYLSYCYMKTGCASKFPCFLNLSPTNLDWPASFLGLSLPFTKGTIFRLPLGTPEESLNQQASLPRPSLFFTPRSQGECPSPERPFCPPSQEKLLYGSPIAGYSYSTHSFFLHENEHYMKLPFKFFVYFFMICHQ